MNRNELFSINIPKTDKGSYDLAKERFDSIAKPVDGLGAFEGMICDIAAVQGTCEVDISKKALVIMIADNGVVKEGVSQTGSSVTASVASLMGQGRSTVCLMLKDMGVDIFPIDVGIDTDENFYGIVDKKVSKGTGNMAKEPAMTEKMCLDAILTGIDTVKNCKDKGINIIATGEMGIGNTTTATALLCALTGEDPEDVVGRGAGLSDEALNKKTHVIKQALELHKLNNIHEIISKEYALSSLMKVGGLDIAALVGVYIGGAVCCVPVVADGMISAVAALTAEYICPGTSGFMIASHTGREKGTKKALSILGKNPVINADMALGEGSGAVMLFPLLDMIMNVYNNGVSFKDTGIMRYERFKK